MSALQGEPIPWRRLSVAIPASVVSDTPHQREKTAKLGVIARASSIFGVNEIILYPDDPRRSQEVDMEFCGEILRYLETPQYLRRMIFKQSPTFKFTGILPPLQIPHHNVPPSIANARIGDIREGLVVSRTGNEAVVDAGLERFVSVAGDRRTRERVTIRLVSLGKRLRGEIIEPTKMGVSGQGMHPTYWGYKVRRAKSLGRLLNDEHWDMKMGTSRYGVSVEDVLAPMSRNLKNAKSAIVAFGSPKMGLREILAAERLDPKETFDYFINTVPNQQTMTVRTEEALLISLGILNLAARLAI